MTLPAPLTSADCDLRDYPAMMLDVRRFRDSDLVAMEKPECVVAAVLLWGAAWHQVPAGSLPDEDKILAQLAGYGRVIAAWKKVRAGALRGFLKCSDGRLYHRTVAEAANAAWETKLRQRHRTFSATIRQHNARKPQESIECPDFEQWDALGRPDKISDLVVSPKKTAGPLFEQTDDASRATSENVTQTSDRVTRDNADCSQDSGSKESKEKGSKGKRIEANQNHSTSNAEPTRANGGETLTSRECFNEVCTAASWHPPNDSARSNALGVLDRWLLAGFDLHKDILAGIGKARRKRPGDKTNSLKRFESTIAGIHEDRTGRRPDLSAGALSVAELTRRTAQSRSVGDGRG